MKTLSAKALDRAPKELMVGQFIDWLHRAVA
jgi:hypothetical protein